MTVRRRPVVALDGPAGAGKSTVARRVAAELGYLLVETGALYRCVALAVLRRGLGRDDVAAVAAVAEALAQSGAIRLLPHGDGLQVRLDDEDVTLAIRAELIGEHASQVSAVPAVRDALLAVQREAGRDGGVVLEGRDIGTAVFPDAEAKFFLTASVDVRARRRFDELCERGIAVELDTVRQDVIERDRRDCSRARAPLRQAPDAATIDSSQMSIADVVAFIVTRVRAIEAQLQSAEL